MGASPVEWSQRKRKPKASAKEKRKHWPRSSKEKETFSLFLSLALQQKLTNDLRHSARRKKRTAHFHLLQPTLSSGHKTPQDTQRPFPPSHVASKRARLAHFRLSRRLFFSRRLCRLSARKTGQKAPERESAASLRKKNKNNKKWRFLKAKLLAKEPLPETGSRPVGRPNHCLAQSPSLAHSEWVCLGEN